MTNEDESRGAAELWWQPRSPPKPREPASAPAMFVRPQPTGHPFEMRWPNANGPLLVALFGLVLSPLGVVAWLWADAQTRAMDAGEMYNERRGTLRFSKVLGALETILLLTVVVIKIGR